MPADDFVIGQRVMRKAVAFADKSGETTEHSHVTSPVAGVRAMLEVSIVWGVLVAMVALSHNGK
jgi:hypothetical protein